MQGKLVFLLSITMLIAPTVFGQRGASYCTTANLTPTLTPVTSFTGAVTIGPTVTGRSSVGPTVLAQGQGINVMAFGAKGDGTTADWTAIRNAQCAALAACKQHTSFDSTPCAPLIFPPGIYMINQPLMYDSVPWVGAGEFLTQLRWNGGSGTAMLEQVTGMDTTGSNAASAGGISRMTLDGGNQLANGLLFDDPIDQTFVLENLHLSDFTGNCLVATQDNVNIKARKLRFDGCAGYDMQLAYHHGASIDISDWTSDKSGSGAASPGYILIDNTSLNQGNPRAIVHIHDARLECCSDSTTFSSGAGVVTLQNTTSTGNEGVGVQVGIDNLIVSGQSTNLISTFDCNVEGTTDCAHHDSVSGAGVPGIHLSNYWMQTCKTAVFGTGSLAGQTPSLSGSGGSGGACYTPDLIADGLGSTDTTFTGSGVFAGGIDPGVSTVSGLGSASSSNAGLIRRVSDSTAISSEGQTCAGGGTTVAMAFSSGSVWKCF